MASQPKNPYRSDLPADELFVGREDLLTELTNVVRAGRNTVRMMMGGRGMGKSSFAAQLAKRLAQDALAIVVAGNVAAVEKEIGRELQRAASLQLDFGRPDFVDALAALPSAHPTKRMVLLLDEIEKILDDPEGKGFLDNLKTAYEKARGKLGIVVLGGTRVLDLLTDTASPFARISGGSRTRPSMPCGQRRLDIRGCYRCLWRTRLREPRGIYSR